MPTPELPQGAPPDDVPTQEPAPTTPPVVEKPVMIEVTPTDARQSRIVDICTRMGEIVAEHDGLVSNIPAVRGSEYYTLKAELDALRNTAP